VTKAKRIGILGLGTVGSGFYEILKEQNEKDGLNVSVRKILVKDPETFTGEEFEGIVTNDIEEVFAEDLDIVVEMMGGVEATFEHLKRFIHKGVDVITANKDLIAEYGDQLFQLANEKGTRILYEASVGGGIPVIKAIRESFAGNRIVSVAGILNGTSNYILSRMEEGQSFKEALTLAQEKGFAEANPESDVKGYDPARKLGILTNICFGRNVDWKTISTQGLDEVETSDIDLAARLGYKIKIIAEATEVEGGILASVKPTFVPLSSALAGVSNEFNGVKIVGDKVDESLLIGKGAGKFPTGSAVFSDFKDVVLGKGYDNRFARGDKEVVKEYWDANSNWILRVSGSIEEVVNTLKVLTEALSNATGRSLNQRVWIEKNNEGTFVLKEVKESILEDVIEDISERYKGLRIKKFRILD